MTTPAFDALAYFEKLKAAGVPEEQAKVQANAFRDFSAIQDEKASQELATKGDIAAVNANLRETELRLQAEIEKVRNEIRTAEMHLLKWQWGIAFALAAIMAKGFGWIGF